MSSSSDGSSSRRRPYDYVLAARMFPWALALPLLKYALPLHRLVRLMWCGEGEQPHSRQELERVVAVARGLYRRPRLTRRDNCLEKSLLTYRFLSARGGNAGLVVGVHRTAGLGDGHVWATLDGRPVHDSPNAIAEYIPVAAFGKGGSVVTMSGTTR